MIGCGNVLSSHIVTNIVFSALVSLTSVFGMRTGGSLPPLSPQWYITDSSGYIYLIYAVSQLHRKYHIYLLSVKQISFFFFFISSSLSTFVKFSISILFLSFLRSSPRPISIGQLNTLLHLHLRPIYLVVFKGSYYLTIWDILS